MIVQRFTAEQDNERGLFSWDLALFRRPRHPGLKDVNTVEKMKTLDLAFSSLEGKQNPFLHVALSSHSRPCIAKNEFLKELAELENVRTIEHNEYDKHFQEMRQRAR